MALQVRLFLPLVLCLSSIAQAQNRERNTLFAADLPQVPTSFDLGPTASGSSMQAIPAVWSSFQTRPDSALLVPKQTEVNQVSIARESLVEASPLSLDKKASLPLDDTAPLPAQTRPEFIPAEPIFDSILEDSDALDVEGEPFEIGNSVIFAPQQQARHPRGQSGIGQEYVMHAPFEVDTTQPYNHYKLGLNLAYGHTFPNRSEYFWGAPPRGPSPESSVDYQDIRLKMETGSAKFSVGTEIPIRMIDPEINPNHAGLGDINITTKTVLMTGRSWQLTQILRTFMSTGSTSMGLGTGHASLEPGILARYKIDDDTFLHASLKYWFPLGGVPAHGGEVLSQGYAWSHVAFDRDDFALIHTVEAVHWAALDGLRSVPGQGVLDVDGDNIVNLYFGSRFVSDKGGDFGPTEFGINWGTALTGNKWYGNLLRFEARFSY